MCTGVETVKQSLNSIETYQGLFHSLNAHRQNEKNKRPVGLYSPLTAGIMTDFVIMIL